MAWSIPGGRNVLFLTAAQAIGGTGAPVIISLGGLVGTMLAPSPALATLPVTLFMTGMAAATVPLSFLMRRAGRQPVYILTNLIGIASGLVAAYGVVYASFAAFCLGTLLAGVNGGSVQSFRFAATDSAPPAERPRAISFVMVGGLGAAIVGPQMVIWTQDALPGIPFAGSFLGHAVLVLLALPFLFLLKTPPVGETHKNSGRPFMEIARTPKFLTAVSAGVVSYGLMTFMMTAAPIAMIACGHSRTDATLGIQWHALAMFGPSFVTGKLIQRFGAERMTVAGLALIGVASLLAVAGLSLFHFWGALILLGVGWNFGFIGATTLITSCHRPEERAKVQGVNDFLIFGFVAVGSLLSGGLLQYAGWELVSAAMIPFVAASILAVFLTMRIRPAAAPAE